MTQTVQPVQVIVPGVSGGLSALTDSDDGTFVAMERIETGSRVAVYKLGLTQEPTSGTPTVNVRREREHAGTIDLLVELRQGYVNESNLGTLIGDATVASVADAVAATTFAATDNAVTYVDGIAVPDLYLRFVESIPTAGTPPTVSGITPSSGPITTPVTITGTGFTGGSASVWFGAVEQTVVTVVSDTEITCEVPAGLAAGSADIEVETTVGLSSSAVSFTVTWVPVLVATLSDDANAVTYLLGDNVDYLDGWLYYGCIMLNEAGANVKPGKLTGTSQTWTRVTDDGAAAPSPGSWAAAVWRFAPSADVLNADTTWDEDNGGTPITHDGASGFIVGIPPGWLEGGTNGADAQGDIDEATGNVTSIAAALSGVLSDSMVLAFVGHSGNEANTATGGTTKLGTDAIGAAPNRSACLVYDATAPGSSPGASWVTAGNARLIAWEVKSA